MGKQHTKQPGPSAKPTKAKRREMRAQGIEVKPAYGSAGVPARVAASSRLETAGFTRNGS